MSARRRPTDGGRPQLSGVVTAQVRAAASSPRPQVVPPGLAIGYGPGPATDGRVDGARLLTAFGLSVALGAVAVRPEVIAYDLDGSVGHWWAVATVAVLVGAVLGAVLNARTERSGPTGPALVGFVGAAAWLALFHTGEPRWVEALLVVAITASVPFLFTLTDARRARSERNGIGAATTIGVAVGLGVAAAAGVTFLDPDMPWATIAGTGGAVAFVGSIRRLRLPDTVGGPRRSGTPASGAVAPSGGAILLGACLGPLLTAGLRLQPYLAEGWQVGARYQFLVIMLAGLVTVAATVAVNWWHAGAASRDAGTDAALLAVLGGAAMLLVAVSQTLPGTVIGAAVAIGTAAAALVLSSTSTTAPALAATVAGVVCTVAWDDLIDAAGSNRVALALLAAPAVVLGAATALGSATAAATTGPASIDPAPIDPAPIDLTSLPHPDLAPASTPLLEVRGIEYSYGSVQALFGVDLDVVEGEITAVVGANGAGKTTFLRTIAGLATPSAGTIRLGGRDLAPFSAADRVLLGINQIAGGGAVAEDLSVADNIAMFGHTLPAREARAGSHRVIEVFPQFADRLGQRASSLSGGERQMLALAKALVLRPRLLIIDELSLGLAPIIVSALVPVIRRLHAEGASVLLVEQSVTVALELADRASCMERGRIVYSSSADALRSDPHLLEAAYLEGITAALEHRGLSA